MPEKTKDGVELINYRWTLGIGIGLYPCHEPPI